MGTWLLCVSVCARSCHRNKLSDQMTAREVENMFYVKQSMPHELAERTPNTVRRPTKIPQQCGGSGKTPFPMRLHATNDHTHAYSHSTTQPHVPHTTCPLCAITYDTRVCPVPTQPIATNQTPFPIDTDIRFRFR